ncbi:MAG: hypothetical protein JO299_05745, partial [Gammaproteobacteria bacterium]|nr:hypothetical protein [Gammaproteobacteria bacterium]
MREHIAPFVYYLEVHLLYASVLCLAAWALTSIRGTNATWKYWIWVATLANFMVPLAGFFNGFAASRVSWATQLGGLDGVGIEISRNPTIGAVLLGVWLLGASFMIARLLLRLRQDPQDESGGIVRYTTLATPPFRTQGIPVVFSSAGQGPSVDGVLRTRISLPRGLDRLLNQR